MEKKGIQTLKNIAEVWPHLSEAEKNRLLGFGEGMAFKVKTDGQAS